MLMRFRLPSGCGTLQTRVMNEPSPPTTQRIIKLVLDEAVGRHPSADVEHERKVAIYDLVDGNVFSPAGAAPGPYSVLLKTVESRMVMEPTDGAGAPVEPVSIPMTPFRTLMKDYGRVCAAYMEAIRAAAPSRIEAIDMGRRGLHNEGAELLQDILKDKVEIDEETSRRLFTVLYVFHMRG